MVKCITLLTEVLMICEVIVVSSDRSLRHNISDFMKMIAKGSDGIA